MIRLSKIGMGKIYFAHVSRKYLVASSASTSWFKRGGGKMTQLLLCCRGFPLFFLIWGEKKEMYGDWRLAFVILNRHLRPKPRMLRNLTPPPPSPSPPKYRGPLLYLKRLPTLPSGRVRKTLREGRSLRGGGSAPPPRRRRRAPAAALEEGAPVRR